MPVLPVPRCRLAFKSDRDAPKLALLDVRIRFWVEVVRLYADDHGFGTVTVTDVDTPGVHMRSSAHYDRRAIDLRVAPFSLRQLERLGEWMNKAFLRSDRKRVALVGRLDPAHAHNDHLHLQAQAPTRQVGEFPPIWIGAVNERRKTWLSQ
ncbi:MAG: hypothetical protein IT377_12180 [Polyangiaceae bacterium]|nr:hypothetical protein [Polyangiaceae bacterium]